MRFEPEPELWELLAVEAEYGVWLDPDYGRLATLAARWPELWDALLRAGGGSGVVRAVVAGIRDPEAGVRLLDLAEHRTNDLLLREAAVIALGRTAAAGAEDRLLALTAADPPIRRIAAREVARLGGAWGLTALRAELDREQPNAAAFAIALALRGDREAVRQLGYRLEEHHDPVAGEVLGRLAVGAAVPGLLGLLHEPDARSREVAIEALAELGDPRALPALIGSLTDEEDLARDALAAVESIAGVRLDELAATAASDSFVAGANDWWVKARRLLHRRRCYRRGRPRSVGDWLGELSTGWRAALRPERAEWQAARLRVVTGQAFEFDAYSLDQQAQARALADWAGWWETHRARFSAGAWFWQGERLASPERWP